MKVVITNVTGSVVEHASLHIQSGVLQFDSGEISHVLYEKQFNKLIKIVEEATAESRSELKNEKQSFKSKSNEKK